MLDIGAAKYVLPCHRAWPVERRPVWTLGMLRSADVEALRALYPAADASETERAAAFEAVGAATLGRSLRAVPPLAFEGEALPALPADADERTEWVRRWLPYRWLADLAKAAQDAADLDPEAE